MSYKAILVHVQNDNASEPRLKCAADLAAQFDAVLIGVGVEMIRTMAWGDSMVDGQWLTAMREMVDTNLKGAEARLEVVGADLAKGTVWESGLDFPEQTLARTSRAADLIVASLGPDDRNDSYRDASPAELALISGRPVIVALTGASTVPGKRIVWAWKDTREARQAMADAMPFFKRADAVLVLEVCRQDDRPDTKSCTDDVVEALKRHGVAAEAKVVPHTTTDGAEIVRQAKTFAADLIVAGAYGHSRLGEWAFGGVTRELLGQRGCDVLLSH